MSDIIIKAENIGKSYIIGHEKREQYVALRDVVMNKVKQIGHKTKQVFQGGQLVAGNLMEEFWALNNINIEIGQGESVGIIGHNGAGKSTLLKILSRITEPTKGRVTLRGRVVSLLEVGTGFHPELSGRENIYLNGAILGMSRLEIKKKFDEIVDFSGIEVFLDTPVKRYSSGMYVRLAFAVAAHLESEIMIIDEVLAVGDAEFQKKCLGKMDEVSKGQGRTVLFVSHNMAAVQQLCSKGIVLRHGTINFKGTAFEAVQRYLTESVRNGLPSETKIEYSQQKDFQLVYAKLCDDKFNVKGVFECAEDVYILLSFKIKKIIPGLYGYLRISKKDTDIPVLVSDSNDVVMNFFNNSQIGDVEVKITIPKRTLGVGVYNVLLNFTSSYNINSFNVDSPMYILSFSLNDTLTSRGNNREGFLSTLLKWEFI